jgi:L-fuculose-phosphate aldolase
VGESSAVRAALVAGALELAERGLNTGSAGNLSARTAGGALITPSGVEYAELAPGDIVEVAPDGAVLRGSGRPSSEWCCHAAIYRQRPEVGAVVHAHPTYGTALACTGRNIPAFHYMVAVAGGVDIPLVPYALFGSESLALAVAAALRDRDACLLANHGMFAVGRDLHAALRLAIEVENLARQYCEALKIGGVRLLSESQMREVVARFATYGQHPEP